MTSLHDTLNDLEAKAKSATPDLNTAVGGGTGFLLFKGGHKFWSNSTSDDQASSDKQYIAACSPDTVLALITALREAREVIEFYAREKNWLDGSVGVDGGDKANAFLAKYPKGEQ